MTVPSGNIYFISLESRYFPRLPLGKYRDLRKTEQMFPEGAVRFFKIPNLKSDKFVLRKRNIELMM